MPRHSPYALSCLNFSFLVLHIAWVSQIIFYNEKAILITFFFWFFRLCFHMRPNCSLPRSSERPLIISNLNLFFNPVKLSVRFSYLVFNEHSFCFPLCGLVCTKPHVAADTVGWWAQVESNHRPHAYQACALTFWAMSPFVSQPSITLAFASLPSLSYPLGRRYYRLVEMKGIEPLTPCLQGRCSPSWATPPYSWDF